MNMLLNERKHDGAPDEENPEWTREMFANAMRLHQLPEPLQSKLKSIQTERKKPNKVAVSIRLSQDVVDQLRASGAGWQSRVDEALRAWLQKSRKAS